jgi:hypothetical protein
MKKNLDLLQNAVSGAGRFDARGVAAVVMRTAELAHRWAQIEAEKGNLGEVSAADASKIEPAYSARWILREAWLGTSTRTPELLRNWAVFEAKRGNLGHEAAQDKTEIVPKFSARWIYRQAWTTMRSKVSKEMLWEWTHYELKAKCFGSDKTDEYSAQWCCAQYERHPGKGKADVRYWKGCFAAEEGKIGDDQALPTESMRYYFREMLLDGVQAHLRTWANYELALGNTTGAFSPRNYLRSGNGCVSPPAGSSDTKTGSKWVRKGKAMLYRSRVTNSTTLDNDMVRSPFLQTTESTGDRHLFQSAPGES